MVDQIEDLAGVAPLVVVPGNEFDKVLREHDARLGSKIEVRGSPRKSEETTASSV